MRSGSGIGWFLCAAGGSQEGGDGDGRHLRVVAVDVTLLSFSLKGGRREERS